MSVTWAPRRRRPSSDLYCDGLLEARAEWFTQHRKGHQPGPEAILHCEAVSPERLGRLEPLGGRTPHEAVL